MGLPIDGESDSSSPRAIELQLGEVQCPQYRFLGQVVMPRRALRKNTSNEWRCPLYDEEPTVLITLAQEFCGNFEHPINDELHGHTNQQESHDTGDCFNDSLAHQSDDSLCGT